MSVAGPAGAEVSVTGLTLYGFADSVYVRAVRMALAERGLDYDLLPLDPFEPSQRHWNPHPMGRVPVLDHAGFRLFETAAILTYLAGQPGPDLIPTDPKAQARMVQVQGIADAYAYRPLVRQVYAAGVYGPARGEAVDAARVAQGLKDAVPVLDMLEQIAAEGMVLTDQTLTLADLHLAPMIAAFVRHPDGAAMLNDRPALARWWDAMQDRDSLRDTDPGLPARA